MDNQWLMSALFDDDLLERIREERSDSSRYTSINGLTFEDELLSISSGSRFCDDDTSRRHEGPKKPFSLVSKPSASINGRHVSLLANHFQITCSGGPVYQYHVQIDPDIPSKKLNRKILNLLEEELPQLGDAHLVYDGWHNVYSTKLIDVDVVNLTKVNVKGVVNTKESPNQFTVWFSYVDCFQLNSKVLPNENNDERKLRMMHAIDTIFRQTSCNRFHVVLQSFFSITPQRLMDPSNGLGWGTVNLGVGREVCYGFYQNVVETLDTLTLNLDVATTTFYRPIALVEFLADVLDVPLATVLDGRALSDTQKKKFTKEVAGLKIETRHCNGPRRFRVARCTWKPMDNLTLHLSDGSGDERTTETIVEYYKKRYGIELQHRHLPCLEVGRTRECILPLELCYIVSGQRCIKKLNEQQIANLIKATSRNASERRDAVLKLRARIGIDEDEYAAHFGLKIDAQMMRVDGRVLSPPRLLYCTPFSKRQDCLTTPNNGTWDMRGKNFYTGVEIRKWAIVCFAPSSIVVPNTIRSFVANLQKVAREIGMPFLEDHCFCRYAQPDQAIKILDFLRDEHPQLQLIVCIVPGKSAVYGDLKRKGDLIGLTTQCVRTHNVTKISPHTLSNLCMKINSKLGGINVVLSTPPPSVTEEPVLFVGCHLSRNSVAFSSDSSSSIAHIDSSIACLVGSMDGHPTRFAPVFRTQARNTNTIVDMRDMLREAIIDFRAATGFKPMKIVVYRSGVTNETVDEIMQTELRAMREACASIEHGFQPGITFIGLDVTHHTRFFATNEQDRIGNSQNVPAGTLVETGITVNNLFEFYLVSHAGIQGTSRPTKYVVMWDDNRMPPNEIHEMTYQLCHTQSRCTRSVSIPSPVYYAKLVAQRAKILMAEDNFDFDGFRETTRRSNGMLFT